MVEGSVDSFSTGSVVGVLTFFPICRGLMSIFSFCCRSVVYDEWDCKSLNRMKYGQETGKGEILIGHHSFDQVTGMHKLVGGHG